MCRFPPKKTHIKLTKDLPKPSSASQPVFLRYYQAPMAKSRNNHPGGHQNQEQGIFGRLLDLQKQEDKW